MSVCCYLSTKQCSLGENNGLFDGQNKAELQEVSMCGLNINTCAPVIYIDMHTFALQTNFAVISL